MHSKRKVAIATAAGLVLAGLAATAAASVFYPNYTTPVSYTMIAGSSGDNFFPGGEGAVGSVLPGQCALIGVGDFIGSTPCSTLLSAPYQLTETPIAASSGHITYFVVTTTNPAPTTGGANRIVFWVRLCEHSGYSATSCNTPPGGMTKVYCSPAAGSRTCSWNAVSVSHGYRFQQWQPGGSGSACGTGICYGKDPGVTTDYGLIDIVASRGCGSSCPNGTYDPGHVSWSVAYTK